MAFVAGAYKWYVGTTALGVVEEAPELTVRDMGQPVKADAAGGAPVEFLGAGKEAFLNIVFSEFTNAGVQALLSTLGAVPANYQAAGNQPPGYQLGAISSIGCPRLTGTSGSVMLHAVALGACASPASFIARVAAIPVNYDLKLLMGSKLRNVPLRVQLFPYLYPNSGANQFWRVFEFHATSPAPDYNTPGNHTSLTAYLNTALS